MYVPGDDIYKPRAYYQILIYLLYVYYTCICLFTYAYDAKTAFICLYYFLVAKSNPYFTVLNLRHQKFVSPYFIRNGSALCLVSAMNRLKQI